MRVSLPKNVVAILRLLETSGHEVSAVGGAVRDLLRGKSASDWDFTTNATPEQIQALFPESFYENDFGTVGVAEEHLAEKLGAPLENFDSHTQLVYEITTYRSDGEYVDFRRPTSVTWGKTLEEDLERRDFTINAMAIQMLSESLPPDFLENFVAQPPEVEIEIRIIDPFHGRGDLEDGIIRTVGNASDRFREDALRMLRAIRFAAQLNFQIDMETLIAIQEHSALIQNISWERIRDEFLKILVTDFVEDAFTLLFTTKLLAHILPEFIDTRGIDQRGHHEFDVWTHSLKACASCPSKDPVVRLAVLLHDIAKPVTQEAIPDSPGEYSFYNHEVIGARTARAIANRLRLSKKDAQRVFLLVRWHMFHYQPKMTDAAIRRFIRRVGVENLDDIMALREGDRVGSGSKKTSWRLDEMRERIHSQLHQPMKITDLAITGTDVMETLGIPPSRQVGDILKTLFAEVLDDPEKNTREYLLSRVSLGQDQAKPHTDNG